MRLQVKDNPTTLARALTELGRIIKSVHVLRYVDDADLARLSPLIWRHINFLGRYNFAVPEVVAKGGLRPLSDPGSEWDF